jgi:integrase
MGLRLFRCFYKLLFISINYSIMFADRLQILKGDEVAKASITSLTESKCRDHVLNSGYRKELSCEKIIGLHLQTLKKDGYWRFRYTDFEGKKRLVNLGKFTGGTDNRLHAAKRAMSLRDSVSDGLDPAAEIKAKREALIRAKANRENGLLGKYLDGIYTQHQARKTDKGKHTLGMIRNHFSQWLGLPMESLTISDLKRWQADKEKDRLSHSTIKRVFGALRSMLRHAVREHVLATDPTQLFQLNPPTAAEKLNNSEGQVLKTRRMLTKSELNGIHDGLMAYSQLLIRQRENSRSHGKPKLPDLRELNYPHWFFPFFHLAAYTGLRTGDLYSLNWHELNIQFKRLVKIPNKTRHHNEPIKVDLPLNDDIAQIMKKWFIQCGKPKEGLVFPSPVTEQKMDKKAHITHWKQILKLGDIKSDIDFYALRHHFISSMVAGGIPLFTVGRLAGHKSVKMIEQHYGHLAPNAAIDALELVARISGNTKKELKRHEN